MKALFSLVIVVHPDPTMMASLSTPSCSTEDSHVSSLLPRFVWWLVNVPFRSLDMIRLRVYNALILYMTIKWYRIVLERLEPNSTILDIGIGTAGTTLEKHGDSFSNRLVVLEGVLEAGKDLHPTTKPYLELTLSPACLLSFLYVR